MFTGSIPVLHTNLWLKSIWSRHLVNRLSSYDHLTDVGRQRDGSQQLSERKGAYFLLNKKEALSWIAPSEWWWRDEWWTSRESLWLPAIGTWGYPIRARVREAMSVMFPISMAPGPHFSISEGFLHSIFSGLRRIFGSWNLVNPLLCGSMEGWMCCQITTPCRSI